jgi:hypothetical protein
MNVEKVLRDYGQFLRPMNEAPRDGRRILGQAASVLVNCYWDINPSKLAGPTWVEDHDADHGYLDRYFLGWIRPPEIQITRLCCSRETDNRLHR